VALNSTISHGMLTTMIQFVNLPSQNLTLVDSNILIYSLSSNSEKCTQAQEFLQNNQLSLCVAQQNIFETLRVLTHPNTPHSLAKTVAIKDVTLVTQHLKMLCPQPETKHVALELIRKYKIIGSKIFDAYLVATAFSNGVTTIATENEKDFKIFDELKIMNPFVPKNSSLA